MRPLLHLACLDKVFSSFLKGKGIDVHRQTLKSLYRTGPLDNIRENILVFLHQPLVNSRIFAIAAMSTYFSFWFMLKAYQMPSGYGEMIVWSWRKVITTSFPPSISCWRKILASSNSPHLHLAYSGCNNSKHIPIYFPFQTLWATCSRDTSHQTRCPKPRLTWPPGDLTPPGLRHSQLLWATLSSYYQFALEWRASMKYLHMINEWQSLSSVLIRLCPVTDRQPGVSSIKPKAAKLGHLSLTKNSAFLFLPKWKTIPWGLLPPWFLSSDIHF